MLDYHASPELLAGKVILVTGAGDGIGRQAALSYGAHGATVILLGKTVKKLEAVYDELLAQGSPEPAIIPLDLQGATRQHYLDMAETIRQQFGRLDGVLFNAGQLGVLGPFEMIGEDEWDKVMQVNVKSQFLMTQALLPLLKDSAPASVVYTSSGVGKQGRAYWGSYAISKFATEGMMQVLADELENTRVRVNCINPGATRTGMRARAYPGEDPASLRTPQDIMPLYLYLMGDDSQGVTGQSLDAQPDRIRPQAGQ
ncbi:YciK family oxidoreductase [Zobellella denitrificans]|jgi:NAD(P)-dependent dehydrogenase (short-subunit alcohol dehydrogenase family)|uniref:3-oxoacyl-ACP reductase n=1 Tax=Zobellella denitrificans TaxID=347534 RepID=A0A231N1I7_9GAMM|nr:YciK family oxidoreductase [Zobellella denitrificans]ATG74393.1 3-oxoacyl-ACP reductase [Zobellella denitrificans]OXS16357.1 YciK family oxidoreductase [Zobellella denitrificans]